MRRCSDVPHNRRCGFSQKIVGILETNNIAYTTFDILNDEGVRQSASFALLSFLREDTLTYLCLPQS